MNYLRPNLSYVVLNSLYSAVDTPSFRVLLCQKEEQSVLHMPDI